MINVSNIYICINVLSRLRIVLKCLIIIYTKPIKYLLIIFHIFYLLLDISFIKFIYNFKVNCFMDTKTEEPEIGNFYILFAEKKVCITPVTNPVRLP